MIDNSKIQEWTTSHFVCYIFLCIAESNFHIKSSELSQLRKHLEGVLGESESFPGVMKEVILEIGGHSLEDKKIFVNENKDRFLSDQLLKEKVIEGIEEIIMADLNIDVDEMEAYRFVKKALK